MSQLVHISTHVAISILGLVVVFLMVNFGFQTRLMLAMQVAIAGAIVGVIVGVVVYFRKSDSIRCDPELKEPGSVFNSDLRCRKMNDNKWQCYLPSADCASFGAEVRKLGDKEEELVKRFIDGTKYDELPVGDQHAFLRLSEGTLVTRDGLFTVHGCISDKTCFDLSRQNTSEAFKELSWPVIRMAVGSILGGG